MRARTSSGTICLVVAAFLSFTSLAPVAHSTTVKPQRLYFMKGQNLLSVPVTGGNAKMIATLPRAAVGADGIAVGGGNAYIAEPNAIWSVALETGKAERIVSWSRQSSRAVAYSAGVVFFTDDEGIGRIAANGTHLRHNAIHLAQERGGGVVDGLAAARGRVYFTRCLDNAIGQASATGSFVQPAWVVLAPRTCPQALATDGSHLYFGILGIDAGTGRIGRTDIAGVPIVDPWITTTTDEQGPFGLAATGGLVFWSHSTSASGPSYIGVVSSSGSRYRPAFIRAPYKDELGSAIAVG